VKWSEVEWSGVEWNGVEWSGDRPADVIAAWTRIRTHVRILTHTYVQARARAHAHAEHAHRVGDRMDFGQIIHILLATEWILAKTSTPYR
jgi:hypothetical protein